MVGGGAPHRERKQDLILPNSREEQRMWINIWPHEDSLPTTVLQALLTVIYSSPFHSVRLKLKEVINCWETVEPGLNLSAALDSSDYSFLKAAFFWLPRSHAPSGFPNLSCCFLSVSWTLIFYPNFKCWSTHGLFNSLCITIWHAHFDHIVYFFELLADYEWLRAWTLWSDCPISNPSCTTH